MSAQEDEELRKKLNDFLRMAQLNDGSVNPNTLNTLERFIKARDEQREKEAQQKLAFMVWDVRNSKTPYAGDAMFDLLRPFIWDEKKNTFISPKSDLVRPKKHINRGDGFTHADNDDCACFTLYSKEDTL